MIKKWGEIDKDGTIWEDDGTNYEWKQSGFDRFIGAVVLFAFLGGIFALISQIIFCLSLPLFYGQEGEIFDFFAKPSGKAFWLRIFLMIGVGGILGGILNLSGKCFNK